MYPDVRAVGPQKADFNAVDDLVEIFEFGLEVWFVPLSCDAGVVLAGDILGLEVGRHDGFLFVYCQ